MKRVFDRLAPHDEGHAYIDWAVLMAGVMLTAFSVVFTLSDEFGQNTDDTAGAVEVIEDFQTG